MKRRKVLVQQINGTLDDDREGRENQVEFNPARWRPTRLIGYEKRLLRKEDFNNDKVDAGEIGAPHGTALYEWSRRTRARRTRRQAFHRSIRSSISHQVRQRQPRRRKRTRPGNGGL